MPVGPFIEDDWDDLLAPLHQLSISIDGSARKEIVNWTGRVPVLVALLLERLVSLSNNSDEISKENIDRIGEDLLQRPPAPLAEPWDDCAPELRADIADLSTNEISRGLQSEFTTLRLGSLTSCGCGAVSGNRVRPACRHIVRFALQQEPAFADLIRLFGDECSYLSNIGGVLELRVSQLEARGADQRLLNYLVPSCRDIHGSPDVALISIRSLVQRALRLIWDEVLPGENTLRKDWVDEWKHATAPRCLDDRRRIPSGDGRQIHARDLLTGKKVGHSFVIRKAVFLTKPSFHLLHSLQSMGDFGRHLSDYPDTSLSTGLVAAVVLSAPELVEALTQDLDSGS